MAVLKLKSKGAEVLELQKKLLKLGYAISADGDFGNQTFQAVLDFQIKNNLSPDGIVGAITLMQIDKTLSEPQIWGIDVSWWNGALNWDLIKQSGLTFCIIKASEGENYKDPRFASNYSECNRLNIISSGYHFYRFFSDPIKQADNFLQCGFDYSKNNVLPPVIDIEWQDNNGASNNLISSNKTKHLANIKKWLDKVQAATGRVPMIYTQQSFWNGLLGMPDGFENYPLWVVDYANRTQPLMPGKWKKYTFWQYSATGHVNGMNHECDLNRFNGKQVDFKKLIK